MSPTRAARVVETGFLSTASRLQIQQCAHWTRLTESFAAVLNELDTAITWLSVPQRLRQVALLAESLTDVLCAKQLWALCCTDVM